MAAAVPWIALSLGAVGTIASAEGKMQAAQAAQQNANYQATVARNNAKIAQQNADYAAAAGSEAATASSLRGAASLARQKVAQAASGVDVNTGSPVDVRATTAETNKLDTETTQHNALLQAYGYKTQAANETAQAGLFQQEANQAPAAGEIGAASSLLGGGSSLAFKWAQMFPSGG